MTEPFLFAIVAIAAVGFAIAMLLSENAVHSALFLIGTMGCIAFMFLLLNAPFLALIQITVYTGAIMVLFLFVIMLLGSERLADDAATPEVRRSRRRFTLVASLLAAAMFVLVGIPLVNVNLDLATETGAIPQVRVVNAAPDSASVDVYANDQLIAADVEAQSSSAYVDLLPGDYTLRVEAADGEALSTDVTLTRGTQQTIIDYGAGSLSVVSDDNATVTEDRSGRLTFFNADSAPVQVLDLGSDLDATDTRVLVEQLDSGASSEAIVQGEGLINWAFVDAADPTNILYRLENYSVARDTSSLVVLTRERTFEGSSDGILRPYAIPVVIDARPSFGGPQAIGLALFTDYMLVFQLLAVLLLASMVGAIVLTHRQTKSETRKLTGRRRVSRPLATAIASQVGQEVTAAPAELQEPAADAPAGQ